MKNVELYNKTVDILVQAYFNDTLFHGSCAACAVGNIVAHNMGFDIIKKEATHTIDTFCWVKDGQEHPYPGLGQCETGEYNLINGWGAVIGTNGFPKNMRKPKLGRMVGKAKEQILSTGYSVLELAKIEFAFETATMGKSDDEWMFNGLMAVIEVLDEIHQNENKEVTNISKQKFTKQIH